MDAYEEAREKLGESEKALSFTRSVRQRVKQDIAAQQVEVGALTKVQAQLQHAQTQLEALNRQHEEEVKAVDAQQARLDELAQRVPRAERVELLEAWLNKLHYVVRMEAKHSNMYSDTSDRERFADAVAEWDQMMDWLSSLGAGDDAVAEEGKESSTE